MIESHFIQTDYGLVPGDWLCIPLGAIGDVKMCKRVMKHQTAERGEVPFYKIGTFGDQPDAFISRALFDHLRHTYSYPKPGTILLSAAGTIGRRVVFDGKDSYFQDSNIVWIDNSESKVKNQYLYFYYSIAKWQTENGGIVVRLYNDDLLSTRIICPNNINEQERIIEALSDVDELLSQLRKSLIKNKRIRDGVIRSLLTGKSRIKGFYGDWLFKNLGRSALIKARIGWQGLTTNEYLDSGDYYLITGTDFYDGGIAWKGCHFVSRERFDQDPYIKIQEHDILVTKDGTIGKVAYLDHIPGPGTLNSGVFVIRTKDKEISQRYLAKVFISKYFDDFIESIVAGSTIIHLYQKDIVKFDFYVPPSIDEQEAICDIIEDMDNEIRSLTNKLDKYTMVKEGMMQQLLNGKIRLI